VFVSAESAPTTLGIDTRLVIRAERPRVPWRVYVNERATMDYVVDLLCLERLV
jgi:hypothetical protein